MRLTQGQLGLTPPSPPKIEGALAAAAAGWKVFPLVPLGKEPYPGTRGFKDATDDPDTIRRWWERHPDANIGGATEASGVLAVDLDVRDKDTLKRKQGVENWAAIAPAGEPGIQHLTASDGFHHLWRDDEGVQSSNGQVAESVDIKSRGGYILLPGSETREGVYRTADGAPLRRIADYPAASEALRAVATSRKAKSRNTTGERPVPRHNSRRPNLAELLADPPERGEGRMNDWLTSVAGHYALTHRDNRGKYERLVRRVAATVDPDYEDTEKVLGSVWGKEQQKPEAEVAKSKKEDGPPLEEVYAAVLEANFDFYKTPNRRPFALPKTGVRRPTYLTPNGQGGLRTAAGLLIIRQDMGKPVWSALETALSIQYLLATEEAPTLELHLRAVRTDRGVVLDLGRAEDTRCVVVTADGWTIQDAPPEGIVFRTSGATRPLPEPARTSDALALARLLGFGPKDRRWLLVRGWLACALLSDIPRPVLFLYGRQGTAKTTKGRMLVNVFDPRDHLGSSFGQNADSEVAMAVARYLVAWDNVAAVSREVSDRFCRLVTGATEDQRELYTNADLVTFEYMRTGVITGLSVPGFQPDALDRMIQVEADRISGQERKTERQVWAEYNAVHAELIGAALDDLATILRRLPEAETQDMARPRMADYGEALWALGPEYLDAYIAAYESVLVDAAESDPFTSAVMAWLESALAKEPSVWATSADAYEAIRNTAGLDDFRPSQLPEWWPRSVRTFSGQLTKNAEPLRAVGFEFGHTRTNRNRGIRFWRVGTTEQVVLPGTGEALS